MERERTVGKTLASGNHAEIALFEKSSNRIGIATELTVEIRYREIPSVTDEAEVDRALSVALVGYEEISRKKTIYKAVD